MAGVTDLVGFLWNSASDKNFAISDETNQIASFEVDAVLSETHTLSRQVTDNKVENGSPVTDHIILNPVTLNIQAIVTDAPIKGIIEGAIDAVDNLLGGSKYTADCFGALWHLYEHKGYLTVYTQYKTYTNMVIENITIPRDPKDGEALVFNIDMKQIRIVESATTTLPPGIGAKKDGTSNAKGDAAKRATPNKDVGKNTGLEVEKDTGASIIKQAKDGGADVVSDIMKRVKGSIAELGLGR
ncbi:tail fiber protein [Xanthomonas phage vB_XveM_DIBBI]|uniref:Structural protein n=2 Tax=Dibbivirus TaxID=2843374 RepID=A0A513ZYL9_9CAUD|nr:tail fiber protein [Xanthomonas phage vB_XveM_DIBBI]YP_009845954.1 tail fiber protein [Pantoea phage vB_PagM_PSKM]AEX65688.1 hypothetical protein DIBBI_020 [Xanthomonas phage vB_XveM_DIBBI]QDH45777.1 structural protein [Pantoea phage vB_PagM_PSKM]